ncbi:MAG TPA: IGHMBP2 family helicase [Planctomycetota bacterium]|nr:IGHMBP2 family helicase [Planctomycetota bacterium]
MPALPSLPAFVEQQLRLIEIERLAEIEEAHRLREELPSRELERRGLALLRLKIAEEGSGLGGRAVIELESTQGGVLPTHGIQPGDIVTISSGGSPRSREAATPSGVVHRVTGRRISVVLDERDDGDSDPGTLDEPLRLDRVANDVTYRRLREALERLRGDARGQRLRLREVLFGLREPGFGSPKPLEPLEPSLDASQREAVAFALEAKDVALIHGPPGTGKTTAAVELIRQAVRRGERVLACAASNVATDNLVERLAAAQVKVVRLGHPARLLPSVVEHSLDSLLLASDAAKIVSGFHRELDQVRRRLRRAEGYAERRARRDELRRLRGELRQFEDRAVQDVLASAEVVLCTNTGAGESLLAGAEFDRLVIDEAAQALEASCWIPLHRAARVVLVGDHRQLPPTIQSPIAEREGLGVTLFERLAERLGAAAMRMLTVQYRMHERIMEWPSRELYSSRLVAHPSVARHLLEQLAGIATIDETSAPLWFIDTAGCGFEEEQEAEGGSRRNEGEAGVVAAHLQRLLDAGVPARSIGVITPYNAQVDCLRSRLGAAHPDLEIGTVDGFQGREKEAILISLVRSNPRGEVGFLADDRRTNVAVTRARRHLAIVGDSATISRHEVLSRLVDHCQASGEYRSAYEYR